MQTSTIMGGYVNPLIFRLLLFIYRYAPISGLDNPLAENRKISPLFFTELPLVKRDITTCQIFIAGNIRIEFSIYPYFNRYQSVFIFTPGVN